MTNDTILDSILSREGGYSDNKVDPGGATNFGITQRTLNEWRTARGEDLTKVRDLANNEARTIYLEWYIKQPRFDQITDDRLRWLLVDTGVNHGRLRAVKWLQAAVGSPVDGVLGPQTLARVETVTPSVVYYRLCATRVRAYADLISANHSLVVFVAGWARRVAEFIEA